MKEKLFVIKIGGNIVDNEAVLASFLQTYATAFPANGKAKAILIHGGGKIATKIATAMGIEQQMVDGRRTTDAETLKVVTMVYAGLINKSIVAQLQSLGCNAMGLTGADGNAILAHKRLPKKEGIDYGFAGDIDAVNGDFLVSLLKANTSIVMAPITHNQKGQLLNTNADTIAQEVAKGLSAHYDVSLIYSFEKEGVLSDVNDDNSVIKTLTPSYYQTLKTPDVNGHTAIFAGMIPKLDNAFTALDSGVKEVVIGKAEKLNALIAKEAGTRIVHE